MSLEFDVFAWDDPNGDPLATLERLESKEIRPALYEVGHGQFRLNRHDADALIASGVLAFGNFVKVRLTEVHETEYQWAWRMERGAFDLVSLQEEAGETVTYSGRGLKALVGDDVMLQHTYVAGGQDPIQGVWALHAQGATGGTNKLGSMWNRVLEEFLEPDRPYTALPHTTYDFTDALDSNGDPWTAFDGAFSVRIGDSGLEVAEALQTIGLVRDVTPDLVEHAYESFGVDRTSATFATGKVRLEAGVNIETGVAVDVDSEPYRSGLLVEGENYTYRLVLDGSAGRVRVGHFQYGNTDAQEILQKAGEGELRRLNERTDEPQVGIVPGDDELNGRYLPWKHFNYGDTVTLHTGTLESDYNEATYPIQAFRIVERQAADDAAVGDPGIDVVLELNRFVTNATRGGTTGPTPVGDELCTLLPAATYYPFWDGNEAEADYPNPGPWEEGGDGNVFGGGFGPAGHSGTHFVWLASLSNPWAYYVFGGDFTAGTTYTFSFWSKVTATAAPATFTFGYDSGTGWPIPAASTFEDSVTLTVSSEETEWTYHELTWTCPVSITSGGLKTTSGVKLAIEFASSSDGVALDDGRLCVTTPGISIGGPGEGTIGSGGTYIPGGTIIEHGDLSGKGGTMHDATQIEFDPTGLTNTTATDVQGALEDIDGAIAAGGAPTTADYLVGTAQAGLSGEIVVGTTPGGELGGTWASPTVDATHSGSAHHTENHASRHANGGADEVEVEDLATAETDTSLVLAPDGTGGVEFRAETGGGSLTVQDEGSSLSTAATTLDFVGAGVTASGTGATKTITIPGGSSGSGVPYLPLDTPPGSAHAKDDEFDGASLDAKWSQATTASGQDATATVANDWLVFEPNTSGVSLLSMHACGYRQAAPSGSFTVMARIASRLPSVGNNDTMPGLFVGIAGGKGHVIGATANVGALARVLGITTISDTADWSAYDGYEQVRAFQGWNAFSGLWYRIQWDSASGELRFSFSSDGVFWTPFVTRTGQSQPDRLGLVIYAHPGLIPADSGMGAGWFRVTEP